MNVVLQASDVEWIVYEDGDLGVKIGDQIFTLYKGESLPRSKGSFRVVKKREFGESCISDVVTENQHSEDDDEEWFLIENLRWSTCPQ